MYSVIRFVAGPRSSPGRLEEIVALLNQSIAETFQRLDRVGGRFSVSLSTATAWSGYETAISEFVHAAHGVIIEARQSNIQVEVDVAIEPDDVVGRPYLSVAMSSTLRATSFLRNYDNIHIQQSHC